MAEKKNYIHLYWNNEFQVGSVASDSDSMILNIICKYYIIILNILECLYMRKSKRLKLFSPRGLPLIHTFLLFT